MSKKPVEIEETENPVEIEEFEHINPLLMRVIERIQEINDKPKSELRGFVDGVPTGFADLDAKTLGLQPADLIIVAGRPSMGKTSFALNIAGHVAIEVGFPVACFSTDMRNDQLAMRLLSSVGSVDPHRMRTGRLSDDEWSRLSFALCKMNDAPLYFDDKPGLSLDDLADRARKLHEQCGKLGLIIVDNIQSLSVVSSRGENRATEVADISRALKQLAKELNVPVIAISQLNRALEMRPNKRPLIADLRESGAIESDADVIMFIYRDEVYNPDTPDRGVAEIIIGKQRNGPIGMLRLYFIPQYGRFNNYAEPGSY